MSDADIREVIIAGLDWLDGGGKLRQPTDRLIRALVKIRASGRAAAAGQSVKPPSDEIKPALEAEWWGCLHHRALVDRGGHFSTETERIQHEATYMADTEEEISGHGKAALYLYEQPFGFDDVHVSVIRTAARAIAESKVSVRVDDGGTSVHTAKLVNKYLHGMAAKLDEAADRITALLPPPDVAPSVESS